MRRRKEKKLEEEAERWNDTAMEGVCTQKTKGKEEQQKSRRKRQR